MGILGSKNLMDSFDIKSKKNEGGEITMEKEIKDISFNFLNKSYIKDLKSKIQKSAPIHYLMNFKNKIKSYLLH